MTRRDLRPPTPAPVTTGLYAVRRSTPQTIAAGDRMRGLMCLGCGHAIGGEPAVTVTITHYIPDGTPAGLLPSTSWLLHTRHHGVGTREIHDLAEWRLGTDAHEEDTPT